MSILTLTGAGPSVYASPGGGGPAWLTALDADAFAGVDFENDTYYDPIAGDVADCTTNFSYARASAAFDLGNAAGLLTSYASDVPRINDTGFLWEATSTNLLPFSHEMNGNWGIVETSITDNTNAGPDGTTTADKVSETTNTGRHLAYFDMGLTANTRYVNSSFLNGGNRRYLQFLPASSGTEKYSIFVDTQSGTITDVDSLNTGANSVLYGQDIEAYANSFFRVWVDFKMHETPNYWQVALSDRSTYGGSLGDDSPSYTGNASVYGLVWGSQVEAATLSSYIPTSGGTAARAAPTIAEIDVSDWGLTVGAGLRYVGGKVGNAAGSTSSTPTTVALDSGLTGGIASATAAGDLIIPAVAVGHQGRTPAPVVRAVDDTAYSTVGTAQNVTADTQDIYLDVRYRFHGGTSNDEDVEIGQSGNAADGIAWAIHVWRGVDTGTPLDGVTPTVATGQDTGRPDPPSITPSATGAVVIVASASGAATGTTALAYADQSNLIQDNGVDTNDGRVSLGSIAYAGSPIDPAASTAGSTNTANSWAAKSFVLRPAAGPPGDEIVVRQASGDTVKAVSALADPNVIDFLVDFPTTKGEPILAVFARPA